MCSGCALGEERPLEVEGGIDAVMLGAAFPVAPQKVEAQAVFIGMIHAEELDAQSCPLLGVEEALEDGVLDALAVVLAGLGDVA